MALIKIEMNQPISVSHHAFYRLAGMAIFIAVVCLFGAAEAQERIHSTFFEDTDYELHVYRICGKEPGKTLLLIGGIQGDEPGGFLSADLYADFSLKKGNLIVVPRANFQSIVLRRRKVNEDMNRKFAGDQKSNYETKVVTILKQLIAESDCLLNLHDGSGFYSEKWEGDDRNPKRFGQSIIADCETFDDPDRGRTIQLGEMARSVAVEINKGIEDPRHHFHFNNHKTKKQSSLHKEQRKSATYYALYTCGIPAFGVETSKSLPLEMKVRHHNLAINAFMSHLGVVPETPGIYLDRPVLKYLVISINDSLPTLVMNQRTLFIKPGDAVVISHIETNYERGLSADIVDFGTINDVRKRIKITKPTRVVVRKDYYPCGSVYFSFGGRESDKMLDVSSSKSSIQKFLFYKVKVNEEERIYHNYEHANMVRGDVFKIVDVVTNITDPSSLVVNFKGYVGDPANNTGEDRGYIIDTGRDLLTRYSLENDGITYQIIAAIDDEPVGKLYLELEKPVLKYLVFKAGDKDKHCFTPGDTIKINIEEQLQLIDVITNVDKNTGVKTYISGEGDIARNVEIKQDVKINGLLGLKKDNAGQAFRIDVRRDDAVLGSVFIQFYSGDAS